MLKINQIQHMMGPPGVSGELSGGSTVLLQETTPSDAGFFNTGCGDTALARCPQFIMG